VLAASAEDPEDLIARVSSKGGTTEAALKIFQKKGFGRIVHEAVRAAQRRSVQLRDGRS
jgi:pyrroline-5-carboxylate reductase